MHTHRFNTLNIFVTAPILLGLLFGFLYFAHENITELNELEFGVAQSLYTF